VNFAVSVKAGKGANQQVSELRVDVFFTDMNPAVAIQTGGALHGKTMPFDAVVIIPCFLPHLTHQDFLNSNRTTIRVPTGGLSALNLPLGFTIPNGPFLEIDLHDILPKARAAVMF
jgi:hypothetical protein